MGADATNLPLRNSQPITAPEVPAVITSAGKGAVRCFSEFFTTNIRNHNTRLAYIRAVKRFCDWADQKDLDFRQIEPVVVAWYRDHLACQVAEPTVKQHLAAIRMLFDWFTTGGILSKNPVAPVRGPKCAVQPKSPILARRDVRTLIDSIDVTKIAGLRDRALIAVMLYAFGRVGAVVAMNVEDYYRDSKHYWFRLHEKEGRLHEMPAHHKAQEYANGRSPKRMIADPLPMRKLGTACPTFGHVQNVLC